MDRAKPFCIPKRAVWEAYKRVRANHGAAGVDGQTIAQFEEDLKANLYTLWNRMSSGSYMAAACETGGDTQGQWRWNQVARHSERGRPRCPDGGQRLPGADPGCVLPCRLLRVSAA